MKYDQKTGEKIPETRTEEIKLSMEELSDLAKRSNGTFDRNIEITWLLRDIDQSLGILVDMLGVLLGKIAKIEEIEPAEENNVQ